MAKSADDWANDIEANPGRFIKRGLFWLVGILIVLSVVGFVVNTVITQPAKVIEKTMDADNVIQNYEWFKQTADDYTATLTKIDNAEAALKNFEESARPRDKWTFEDKNEWARLNTNITGLKSFANDLVAQYNARSKMLNRKLFKGTDVPYRLEEVQ